MIRTKCAFCAVPLAHTAPRCGRCQIRLCGRGCQKLHWKAGHKNDCKKIELGGGAEQYCADTNCAEAIAVAVEECADDTKGQTCYICTEALHYKTKEGLVRGCACRGTAGFAHVSCLAEQAKVLVAEAEENNLGEDAINARWRRWHTCGLCKQSYHGVVRCAFGWACWKTYLGRPETDWAPLTAMKQLGIGLYDGGHYKDAVSVMEAELATGLRLGGDEHNILAVQTNLANSYAKLGRLEESVRIRRDTYSGRLRLDGELHPRTLSEANNYANTLLVLKRFAEAKSLLRKIIPVAQRVVGENHDMTLSMRGCYAETLYKDDDAMLDDFQEAASIFEETARTARRVLGGTHPLTVNIEHNLRQVRAELRASLDSYEWLRARSKEILAERNTN